MARKLRPDEAQPLAEIADASLVPDDAESLLRDLIEGEQLSLPFTPFGEGPKKGTAPEWSEG